VRRAGAAGVLAPLLLLACAAARADEPWRPLWNGKDLTGWQTYLGGRGPKRPLAEALGVDKDPLRVFSVVTVDGAPALRVSGELWGALTTREEFSRYHFRVAWRWGTAKWPPRDRAPRDSGICYHSVGPYGAGSLVWMQSIEAQIMEGDSGSFYSVGGTVADVRADSAALTWQPGAPLLIANGRRIARAEDVERPAGRWNTSEVLAVPGMTAHVVNGRLVMVLENPRRIVEGRAIPLDRGRIQLQSEGAEIFFRDPEIRRLERMPEEISRQAGGRP